jgi:anti-sigma B factor antagonist
MAFNRSELVPFRVDVVPDRDEVRVCPVGEIDLAAVPLLDAELAELWSRGFARLVLDLRDIRFLDSTGIRMLLSWQAASSADGSQFSVIPGPPMVERVLEIAGVTEYLTYARSDGLGSNQGRAFGGGR